MPKPERFLLLRVLLVTVSAAVLSAAVAGASQSAPIEFELYPADSNMGRTNLIYDETATARPVLMRRGTHIFQVLVNKRTGRELFRVDVGTTEATYWVYGVVREADFNGDGIPDFSWHGGDDTSDRNLVALSSSSGYKKLDLEATLRGEWRRRFPSDPREDSLIEPVFSGMKLVRKSGKLHLEATIHFSHFSGTDGIRDYERLLRVSEQNSVHVR